MRFAPSAARSAAVLVLGHLIATAMLWPGYVRGQTLTVLNPKDYDSPSGTYRLRVDPGNRYGAGKATYRLTKGGKEIWSGERRFTLWEAGVTDDGTVAGYAYSSGRDPGGGDAGDLRVIILDPGGAVRLDHRTRRSEGPQALHAPPDPVANALIVDPANDRVAVHVSGSTERWRDKLWMYQLTTGRAEGRIDPKERMPDPEPASYILAARAVLDTPLILLHWWRRSPPDSIDGDRGARFTLIDPKGETVWSFDLPKDYTRRDDEDGEARIRREVHESGGILRADQPGRFDLRFAAENRRVTFAVERRPNGQWNVREVARQQYAIAPKDRLSEIPEKPLPYLGAIALRSPGQKPSADVRDTSDFVIDGSGRLAFLRGEPDGGAPSFVLVDQAGTVIRVARLNVLDGKSDYRSHLTWCGGDRFLVAWSHWGVGAKASACWIDGATGRITALEGFDCPAVERLAGFPDGGFAALAKDRAKNTSTASVYLFDARGRLFHRIPQDYSREPGTLFSPEDVAVTTEGKVAVLDVIRHNISVFDGRGAYLRTIDLKEAWKREPNYPSHLAADADGGLIVGDSNGRPPIVRMRADGTVREELTAKYADGRTDATMQHVRTAPDGRVWTSDGDALLRLDAKGVVDKVIGEPPDPNQLDYIASLTVDRRGRIYAVAARSAAIHVFDSAGKHLRICRPEPTDFGALGLPDVTVAESGDVYLGTFDRRGEYLRFSPDGKRVGFERLGLDTTSEEWRFQPAGTDRWVLGYEKIFLVSGEGEVRRTIARRPDGQWLESLHDGVVGPDGSLAVTSGTGWEKRDVTMSLYDRIGNPLRTIPLPMVESPFARFGYDGERVAIVDGNRILMFDKTGRPVQQFRPPATRQEKPYWRLFLMADQRQLWVFDGQHTMHRYALP